MRARSATSGLRYREEVDETEEETEEAFWWRLCIGDRLFLVDGWAGEADDEVRSPEEFSNSDALVGGDEARGEDLWGEVFLFLLEL